MPFSDWRVIVSCEHGGRYVPRPYKHLFQGNEDVLRSHRGWDIGALYLAKLIAKELDAPLYYNKLSRLVVEFNRSLSHPHLFSEFTQVLSTFEKQAILKEYYVPYRNYVEQSIRRCLDKKQKVLHLSIHSFTPILNGIIRSTDIGLLYDPKRDVEREWSALFKKILISKSEALRVRYNYPYLGIADGFTTYLRSKFPATHYAGIEFEMNQMWLSSKLEKFRKSYLPLLIDSFVKATN